MDRSAKISVTAGDVEFELDGSPTEIEEGLSHLRQVDSWSIMVGRLKVARDDVLNAAVDAAKASGLPGRGADFKTLIETYSLNLLVLRGHIPRWPLNISFHKLHGNELQQETKCPRPNEIEN